MYLTQVQQYGILLIANASVPPAFLVRGFLCPFVLFHHLRLPYVAPAVACRIQYNGMKSHCLLS